MGVRSAVVGAEGGGQDPHPRQGLGSLPRAPEVGAGDPLHSPALPNGVSAEPACGCLSSSPIHITTSGDLLCVLVVMLDLLLLVEIGDKFRAGNKKLGLVSRTIGMEITFVLKLQRSKIKTTE